MLKITKQIVSPNSSKEAMKLYNEIEPKLSKVVRQIFIRRIKDKSVPDKTVLIKEMKKFLPKNKKEIKKEKTALSIQANKLFDSVKSKLTTNLKLDIAFKLKQTNQNTIKKVIVDLETVQNILINKKAKKLITKQAIANFKKQDKDNYTVQKFSVSLDVIYHIINVDKQGNEVPSDDRTRYLSTVTHPMYKYKITKDFLMTMSELFIELFLQYDERFKITDLLNINIAPVVETDLSERKLGLKKYSYRMFEDIDKSVNINEGECVIDYLFSVFNNQKFFKWVTREKLISFFGGKTASVNDIINFAQVYGHTSVYALNPLMEIFTSYQAEHDPRFCLCFIVNDDHIYPIVDRDLKHSVTMKQFLDLDEFKFNVVYENEPIQYITDYKEEPFKPNTKILLFDEKTHNIIELMKLVMEKTENIITNVKFACGLPVAFQHPVTKQVYEITENFNERKSICEFLTHRYGQHIIKFTNQSYTEISKLIFNNEFGSIKQITSNLSENIFDTLDTHHIKPFCATVNSDTSYDSNSKGIDIIKSYSSVLLSNTVDYAVFQAFDEVQEFNERLDFVPGEYYICKSIRLCDGLMSYPRGYYPLNFVLYCIEKNAITKSDITMYIPARQYLPANTFREFVKFCYMNFDEDEAKKLVNYFIGHLGAKRKHIDKAGVTTKFEIACALYFQYSDDSNVTIDRINDFHFVRVRTQEKNLTNGLTINRHVICGGIINLANLYYELKASTPDIKVIAFNTDSIMYKEKGLVEYNDYGYAEDDGDEEGTMRVFKKKRTYSILKLIGTTRLEKWKIKSNQVYRFEDREEIFYKPIQWNTIKEEDTETLKQIYTEGKSCLISGMPGCGKTELIKNIYNEKEDLVLSFTNTAVFNARDRCNVEDGMFKTFDTFFNEQLSFEAKIEKAGSFKRIIIDEYSMVPACKMILLDIIKKTHSTQLLFFGDNNQCLPINEEGIVYDYFKTSAFKSMCDSNLLICSYKKEFSRYDEELKQVLDVFVNSEKGAMLPLNLKYKKADLTYINICKSLSRKWYLNLECASRYYDEKQNVETFRVVKFDRVVHSKLTSYTTRIGTNQKVMCITNEKKDWNLFNGTICSIIKITDNAVTVRNDTLIKQQIDKFMKVVQDPKAYLIIPTWERLQESLDQITHAGTFEFTMKQFLSGFEPLYAQTVYKFQGATIREPYTIHEINSMSKREIYTALSRGTSLSNVKFNYTCKNFVNVDISKPVQIKMKVDNEVDEKFINSKIYKICFQNFVYIGQTHQSLEERLNQHKRATKGSDFIKVLQDYKEEAKIELIEDYPCKSLREILNRELYYIEQYSLDKSITLLNTCGIKKVKEIKTAITQTPIIEVKSNELEQVNEQIYHFVKSVEKNSLRFKRTINGKKIDIQVSLKNRTEEEAKALLLKKLNL